MAAFDVGNELDRARQRLARAWRLSVALWPLIFAGGIVVFVLAAGMTHLWWRGISQASTLLDQVLSVQAALHRPAQAPKSVDEPRQVDFVHGLPGAVDVQSAVATVSRAAADASVALTSVQLQSRAGTPELLARTDLVVQARGAYPKLKQVISDVLGRYPNATLNHLNLRRNGPLDQAEATVVFGMWGAPMARSAPGAR